MPSTVLAAECTTVTKMLEPGRRCKLMKVTGRKAGNYARGARRRRCQGSHRGPEWLGLGESGKAPRGGDAGAAFEGETGSFPSRTAVLAPRALGQACYLGLKPLVSGEDRRLPLNFFNPEMQQQLDSRRFPHS